MDPPLYIINIFNSNLYIFYHHILMIFDKLIDK